MPEPAFMRFGVVVLAAGKSSRMGCPKMLLPWGGTTLLGHGLAVWAWLEPAQVAVVCDPGNDAVLGELDRLRFAGANRIMNPRVEEGMFGSVLRAARWGGWRPGLSHWVFSLGDQPLVLESTLRTVVESARARPELIWQPARGGRPRHPVILPGSVFGELADAKEATLKEFLETKAVGRGLVEVDDPGLDRDLDTPEDYQKAVEESLRILG